MQFVPYHSRDGRHKSVFGAIAAGTPLRLCVCIPANYDCSGVTLILHEDGKEATFTSFAPCGELYGADAWEATLTIPSPGLYFYHFSYNTPFGEGSIYLQGAGCGVFSPSGAEWQLTVYDAALTTPEWPKGGILYQVFPDRFCKGAGDVQNVPADRIMHRSTDEKPEWRPDGEGKIRNNDYYGGNLAGITEKLDYLTSLGVTMLYLNPIFEAHESHRYNTADYTKIDPLLGSEADFKTLCAEAKKRGIRVILDGVFSHTGADSVYFNREKRYGEGGAFNDENSPYRPWYTFTPDGKYKAWWGIDTLPEVNEDDPSYIDFICGEDGIAAKWLRAGASGWRLDVADELPDGFLDALCARVKAESPDYLVLGEVWEDASNKISHGGRRRYLLGKQLDSVMNYPFANAILDFLLTGSAEEFTETVLTICEHYPKPILDCLMNHIGTHDTARILTRLTRPDLASKPRAVQAQYRITEEEKERGVRLLKEATVLQYTLPGFPSIYYGDEAGMSGGSDPFNRAFFPWGHEDADLTDWYRRLGKLRRRLSCLADGTFRSYSAMLSCVAYVRENATEKLFVISNRNENDITYNLPAEFQNGRELLTDASVCYDVPVPACGSALVYKRK